MSLVPGTHLGPYEITAPLGAGGMGEVYRARDTRLERTVAIKILPAHFSADPIRKRRFEHEARTLSSLNHPHICVLHDFGSQDDINYLVMECIEGTTLAKQLEKGPLPLDQVLNLGAQVADALDKAHQRGIIHRDLKPGNIMLTSTGAKVLDFGLAKSVLAVSGATLSAAASQTTTVTESGVIVGTLQYMSPEQVEARELDGRSDIFSLGAVLYEMLTGRRAFQGSSQLSVASAILGKEPVAISSIKPMTPPALDHAIRRCLAKEPERRWQSAGDLAGEMHWFAECLQAGTPAAEFSKRKLHDRLGWVVAAILIIALLFVGAAWWQSATNSPVAMPIRLSAQLQPGAFIDRFRGAYLAISPDGTRIVITESDPSRRRHLAMRSLDQTQFVPLPGADDGFNAFFSPDSQWIGFYSVADHKLKKIAVNGGEPIALCNAPVLIAGASWGDDGNIIAAFMGESSGLVRIPSTGGASTVVTQLSKEKGETAYAWPQVLPGSQYVLFTVYGNQPYPYNDAEIVMLSLRTGERKIIHRGGIFGRYLLGGYFAYMHENTLFVAPFDLRRLSMTGPARPVLEEINSSPLGHSDFDFSRTGTLAYVSSKGLSHNQISWLDSTGQTKPLQSSPDVYQNPRFSPDGTRLAFEVSRSPVQTDIWVKDLERGPLSRLTHLSGVNRSPLWTPDGKSIVFVSYLQEASGIYLIRADGASEAQRLSDSRAVQVPRSFSPDGRRLAYYQNQLFTYTNPQIWTAQMEGGSDHPQLGKAEAFLRTPFSEIHPAFSPDGHWLAYSSNESGNHELYVRPFPGPGGKVEISVGGGQFPIWSRDEHKLFFLGPDLRIMVADYTVTADSFIAGRPQVWSQRTLMFLGNNYPYDLAPDGKQFAVVMNSGAATGEAEKPTDSVTVVLNFFQELRRSVPSDKN